MKTLAGIVLYNPDIERLKENIAAIEKQVDCLLFIDNASKNLEEALDVIPSTAVVLKNEKNLGSATALNQICQYALDNGYEWALTLDQDSVVAHNLMSVYKEVAGANQHLGMICCKLVDRNFDTGEGKYKNDLYVTSCITSASYVNIMAWQDVGGFDDTMFIDRVDFDFCAALWKAGWGIYKTIKTEILHEIGHTRKVKVRGRMCDSNNEKPFRYYYIARNILYEVRKFRSFKRALYELCTNRLPWVVWLYEEHKWAKTKEMIRGAWDGMTCPIWKPQPRVKGEGIKSEIIHGRRADTI